MARIRKNVWDIENDANDQTLAWYGAAIGRMRARPIADPKSWRYQAAIHEYDPSTDPFASSNDALPGDAGQFWTQCQHNSWFFLPWHRMFLLHFERIVAAEVAAAGGPSDWALPYWNYSKDPSSRLVPSSFRNPQRADGTENFLFVAARNPGANEGGQIADERDVDLGCLREPDFEVSQFSGLAGFGGPESGFNHGGGAIGALEVAPHGSMHVAVGGWMGSFSTAGLDPLFWLHHANIDRLWQVWLKRPGGHANPSSSFWRSGVRFPFHDVGGGVTAMTASDVIDTAAPALDYRYDDVSDPMGGAPLGLAAAPPPMSQSKIPEMIGATHAPLELAGGVQHAVLPAAVAPAAPPGRGAAPAAPRRFFLRVEHLTGDKVAPAYDLYLGVAPGEDPNAHPDKHVGRLPMFGLVEASRDDGPHAGSGLTFAFEVTHIVDRLSKLPGWKKTELPISFVAVGAPSQAKVRVGRVSLYTG